VTRGTTYIRETPLGHERQVKISVLGGVDFPCCWTDTVSPVFGVMISTDELSSIINGLPEGLGNVP